MQLFLFMLLLCGMLKDWCVDTIMTCKSAFFFLEAKTLSYLPPILYFSYVNIPNGVRLDSSTSYNMIS